ncbi:MAG TPA: ferritin family protein [Usitatibacter sp.]|nr:ferritin family protein [Usitatibacter sp.]
METAPILDVESFYAHAIAIEREAVRRYREFEAYFQGRGDEVLAGLCGQLAQHEDDHLRALGEASRGLALPELDPASHRWLSRAAEAGGEFYRVVNAQQLLAIALASECDALGFFEWVASTTPEAGVRALAGEMVRDEMDHVRWVRDAIEYHRDAVV